MPVFRRVCGDLRASFFTFFYISQLWVLAAVPPVGEREARDAQRSERPGNPPREIAKLVNRLAIGCSQVGAVNVLLERGAKRVELVGGSLALGSDRKPEGYDEVKILRLGNQSEPDAFLSGKVYLFFREGFVFRKCVVPDGDEASPEEIFRREISSGLQHPPSYPGFMDKVHWGPTKKPRLQPIPKAGPNQVADADNAQEESDPPSVRCGIAIEGLPPQPKPQDGMAVAAVYQNLGPGPIEDEIYLLAFVPVCRIRAVLRAEDASEGPVMPFGIYGTKVLRLTLNGEKWVARMAPFKLEAGDTSFVLFEVPNRHAYSSLQANFSLTGAGPKGFRDWGAESPAISIFDSGKSKAGKSKRSGEMRLAGATP